MTPLPFQPAPSLAQLSGARVCIWGIGSHGGGMAAAALCALHGAQVHLLDQHPEPHRSVVAQQGWLLDQGHVDHPWLRQMDWVIVSPAITPRTLSQLPHDHAPLSAAEGWCLANHQHPRIMVTGTKGKSSTAAILGALLGWPVMGNSWTPMAAAWPGSAQLPWICELSSFQLAQLARQAPSFSCAILTSLDRDHLDWHGDLEQYHASKLNGLRWAQHLAVPSQLQHLLPQERLLPLVQLKEQHFVDQHGSILAQRSDLPLLGSHHASNACLALSVALHHGLDPTQCAARLRQTAQLPHRLQVIHRDARYTIIDDSTATTPLASRAALASIDGPVALILGGHDKGGDFSELWRDLRARQHRMVLLIGDCAEALALSCIQAKIPFQRCVNLHTAVTNGLAWIASAPDSGTLLLAPACASFGSFQDFADRGRQFAQAVQASLQDMDMSPESP
ncbi:MAG: UDP-N-acetylmuramoyl-L-alanine--D-glutamate ligase [Planctomycetota bacterium]|nr:MAG: UDP-N-acetylmuramoyl-L-alanine--D-glutamate ligase [Planctomycetota bacterium]